MGSIVSIVDSKFGPLEQSVGNDQTSRSTSTLLAVDKHTLASLGSIIDNMAQVHKIGGNVSVVVPRNMDILGLLELKGLGRCWCLSRIVALRELPGCHEAGCGHGSVGLSDRHRASRGLVDFKWVADLPGAVDDHIKACCLLCGRFRVEEDVVSIDGNWSVRVSRSLHILIVLIVAVRIIIPKGHLSANGRVLFRDGGMDGGWLESRLGWT